MPSNCTPEGNVAGHAWEWLPATKRPSFGVPSWWRCSRCGRERHDILNRFSGELEDRQYEGGLVQATGHGLTMEEKRIVLLSEQRKRRRAAG